MFNTSFLQLIILLLLLFFLFGDFKKLQINLNQFFKKVKKILKNQEE